MATINSHTDKAGKTTYRARVRVKGHPTHTRTFRTKTAAKRWAQSLETKLREGASLAFSEAQRHTLAEAIDRYLETVLPRKAASTIRDQTKQLEYWKQHYGELLLSSVTTPVLAEGRDKLAGTMAQHGKNTLTPASVNRSLAALSHVLTIATKEWYWLSENPMDRVSRLKENNARTRYLDEDELPRLIHVCRISESADLLPAVLLTVTTGARRNEVMELEWKHVDLDGGAVTFVDTKNGDDRSVGLVPEIVDMLRQRGGKNGLLFPSPSNPDKPIDLRSAWETALRRAEIQDFRWHDLRHTSASYLAMSGASTAEIAAVLGHRTLTMVKRYSHLSPQHTAKVATRIGAKVMEGLKDE